MKLFTCYYLEQSRESTSTSITGPTIHKSFEDALEVIFEYVKDRIFECGLESMFSDEFKGSEDNVEEYLKHTDPSTKEDIADWYFNFMDDDLCDAKYYIEEHGQDDETSKWEDDKIQFARLIAEINANVGISEKDFKSLCESMDLDQSNINKLFDRADSFWEETKANV